MAQRILRFGINDGHGLRAATWKLWTETSGQKSEVYLACRSLGGKLKASLHQSGAWHVAYSKETFKNDVSDALPDMDRYIQKWPRPAEIAPGVTLAYRIVTPWSATTIPIDNSSVKDMVWLPAAPKPQATEIDILIVKPITVVSGWPGQRSMGTSLIGSMRLENGETVWAVCGTVPMPDMGTIAKGPGHFFKGRDEKDLQGERLRVLAFGELPDGSRVMYDCAVQRREQAAGSVERNHRQD